MNLMYGILFLLAGSVITTVFFGILFYFVFTKKSEKPNEKNALIDFLRRQNKKKKIRR